MPIVYEFDENMSFQSSYTLMDKEAHAVIKDHRELSYNSIDWMQIRGHHEGGIQKSEISPLTKPLIRYSKFDIEGIN
jgi:hypothetical protein|tara:strand:- start:148 stop:378 length:231 start_codon:yes stop_codon:yes gene_type:complete